MKTFEKATKRKAKLRMALDGPSGSGKTYTALEAAKALANGGKVAVIDTERGSASLYADHFNFDVCELDNFNPQNYIEAIEAAEKAGYGVIVIDSLSHAWEGEGGALDMVEDARRRQKVDNSFTAWKDVTPLHRRLVDAMLQSPAHIIATMRSKTEYVMEKDGDKTKIRKVGLAPIQRQGMEYEFTIVGDLDLDHTLVISKSRMESLADQVERKPGETFFRQVKEWLESGAEAVAKPAVVKTAEVKKTEDAVQPGGNGTEPVKAPQPADQKPVPEAWKIWHELRTEAISLGLEVEELAETVTVGEMRLVYKDLLALVKDMRGAK